MRTQVFSTSALLRASSRLSAIALAVVFSACTQRVETVPMGGVGHTIVLEQFLSAANAQDLVKMGTLFGTADKGAISGQWPKDEVEKRMFIFANVLRHDDYKIEGETLVPGRLNDAKQLNVSLTRGQRKVIVPFTLVRTKKDSWLVEMFDLEKLIGSR